jgi:formiminotetrahydrofolate cyclodeaminase
MTTTTFSQLPTPQLLARFADSSPAPGGGSAAALAGALAGSLVQMVANLTVGKKGYEASSDEAGALRTRAEGLSARLFAAVEEDARSFERVMDAMGLPKETDDEKAARRNAMQQAFKGATMVPMETSRACLEAAQLALRLVAIGNQNASTDAGVAVLMAVAGGEGALFNAEINLGSIKDAAWVAERRGELDPIWRELESLRGELWMAMRKAGVEVPR